MRRTGAVAVTAILLSGTLAGQLLVSSAAAREPSGRSALAREVPAERLALRARLSREVARHGDQDAGTRRIEHVRELQYRLRWAGAYRGPVTGYFGDLTRAGVQRYQRRIGIRPTGVARHSTWAPLITRTVRHERALPRRCTNGRGWHACYDRRYHQLTLWKRGRLWNSWLVRGGARGYETRTGRFQVFYRDRDHVSGLYDSPMPFSQFFSGGQAFHGSTYMMDPFSGHSHGCVNMYIEDARQLWRLTRAVRLDVHVYGRWS